MFTRSQARSLLSPNEGNLELTTALSRFIILKILKVDIEIDGESGLNVPSENVEPKTRNKRGRKKKYEFLLIDKNIFVQLSPMCTFFKKGSDCFIIFIIIIIIDSLKF